jgi:hypothetical protein
MSIFGTFDEDELSGGGAGEITEDGLYWLKVISAFDTYKVNPEDKDDPNRPRRISMRVKVVKPIRDTRGDYQELEEDFERRKDQVGNISRISIFLARDGNSSLLEGHMKLLNAIAGSPRDDRPDEELLEQYRVDGQGAESQYELGPLVDEMHVNCSALLGRDFIAEVEDTSEEWPSFYPWYGVTVDQSDQTTFDHPVKGEITPEREPLHAGEDKASKRAKEKFDDNGQEQYAGSGASDGDTFQPEEDDDLPF